MVSAATRVAAVIGDPVRHAPSPAIHNPAFAATGLDGVYVAFGVAGGRGAERARAMGGVGGDGGRVPRVAGRGAGVCGVWWLAGIACTGEIA